MTELRPLLHSMVHPNGTDLTLALHGDCATMAATKDQLVLAGNLREELWIDDKGYIRSVPLTANNTAVNWNSPEAWTQCCTNNTPLSQDGYIV